MTECIPPKSADSYPILSYRSPITLHCWHNAVPGIKDAL